MGNLGLHSQMTECRTMALGTRPFAWLVISITLVGCAEPTIPKDKVSPETPPDVRLQIERLHFSNARERGEAAYPLGKMDDRAIPAIPFLIRLLDDTALIQLRDYRPKVSVGHEAAVALVNLRKPAVRPLCTALNHKRPCVRCEAAWALGEIRDPLAAEALIGALKDEHLGVRRNAVRALGNMKVLQAVQPVIRALNDENWSVRENAAHALGKIKDATAVKGLTAALKDKKAVVREQAAWALGEIKDIRATESLIAALGDSNQNVRYNAAWALGVIRHPRGVAALMHALKDEHWSVRACAARALGNIRDPRAVQSLIDVLKDTNFDVRRAAASALKEITGESHDQDPEKWHRWREQRKEHSRSSADTIRNWP